MTVAVNVTLRNFDSSVTTQVSSFHADKREDECIKDLKILKVNRANTKNVFLLCWKRRTFLLLLLFLENDELMKWYRVVVSAWFIYLHHLPPSTPSLPYVGASSSLSLQYRCCIVFRCEKSVQFFSPALIHLNVINYRFVYRTHVSWKRKKVKFIYAFFVYCYV